MGIRDGNPFYEKFKETFAVIEDAWESDGEKGKAAVQEIIRCQTLNDEDAVNKAWEKYFEAVPSAKRIQANSKKHREMIEKLEKAMGVVIDHKPDYSMEQFQKGCDKLLSLYLEGFIRAGSGYIYMEDQDVLPE